MLSEAPARHRNRVILLDVGHPAIERGLIRFFEKNRDSGVRKHHGDAAAHRACADNRSAIDGDCWSVFRHIRDFRDFAFTEENVNERFRLI